MTGCVTRWMAISGCVSGWHPEVFHRPRKLGSYKRCAIPEEVYGNKGNSAITTVTLSKAMAVETATAAVTVSSSFW